MEIKSSWVVNKPIAHRGLHNFDYPENSLPAFKNAVDNGFAIELDVRLIDDNNIVTFFDDKLSRMTNRDGYVANLKVTDLDNIKLKKTEYSIPTLEQVLELVNGKVPILIDVKKLGHSFVLEKELIDMLKGYNGDYAVESFDPYSLQYFYDSAPQILRGQLSSFFHHADFDTSRHDKRLIKRLKFNDVSHPDFVAYKVTNLPNKFVKNAGLPVVAWTVKSELQAQKVQSVCDNYMFEGFVPKTAEQKAE